MNLKRFAAGAICALALTAAAAQAQSTSVSTEYLMTLYAPLGPPQQVNSAVTIYPVSEGGWVKGPKINGKVIGPGGDWARVDPTGSLRLDVRISIRTDDGALIYTSYNGIISQSPETYERFAAGEVMKADDMYFVIAPTFQTSAEKYAWLNHVQAVGKMVEVKTGEGSYVKYDIFIVR